MRKIRNQKSLLSVNSWVNRASTEVISNYYNHNIQYYKISAYYVPGTGTGALIITPSYFTSILLQMK